MKSVLPIGRYIVCTFGHLTYPFLVVMMLIELAKFLGLTYKRNLKSTAYALVIMFSIFAVIQSISTYSDLDKVVGTASLGEFLKLSYTQDLTLMGAAGSLVVVVNQETNENCKHNNKQNNCSHCTKKN